MLGLLLLLASAALAAGAPAARITINTTTTFVLPPAYLSFNLDPSCNRGFHQTNFSNPNLAAAGRFLAPARLRFGGSGANALTYGLTPGSPECAGIPQPPPPLAPGCDYGTAACLNATQLDDLFTFAAAAGTDFIFGLSYDVGAAAAGRPLNTSNIEALLAYLTPSQATPARKIWGAEIGNEVNLAQSVSPAHLAADAMTVTALLAAALPGTRVIGPDTGQLYGPTEWAAEFVGNSTPGVLAAVTNHWYTNVVRADFAAPATLAAVLDAQLPNISGFSAMVRARAPGAYAWAGEVGPHGGGDDGTCGPNSTCGVFASAIWYADDACARAAAGHSQHNRQTLFGGNYGLVDSLSGAMALDATAPVAVRSDYWVPWIMKRALGPAVLSAASSDAAVRAYAFAGYPPSPFAARGWCSPAGAQLLLINLGAAPAAAALPGAATSYAAWSLTPAGGDVFAAGAALNGRPLPAVLDVASGDTEAFQFLGAPVTGAGVVALPGWSVTVVCTAD